MKSNAAFLMCFLSLTSEFFFFCSWNRLRHVIKKTWFRPGPAASDTMVDSVHGPEDNKKNQKSCLQLRYVCVRALVRPNPSQIQLIWKGSDSSFVEGSIAYKKVKEFSYSFVLLLL